MRGGNRGLRKNELCFRLMRRVSLVDSEVDILMLL